MFASGRPVNYDALRRSAQIDSTELLREAYKQGMEYPLEMQGHRGFRDQRQMWEPRLKWQDHEVYAILAGALDGRNKHDWMGILNTYKLYFHPKRTNISVKDKWETNHFEIMQPDQLVRERDRLRCLPSVREKIAEIEQYQKQQQEVRRATWLQDHK